MAALLGGTHRVSKSVDELKHEPYPILLGQLFLMPTLDDKIHPDLGHSRCSCHGLRGTQKLRPETQYELG